MQRTRPNREALLGLLLTAAVAVPVWAQSGGKPAPPAKPHPAPSAKAIPSPAVRDVAANPAAHLGHLVVSGVVGIATPKKGFVLVDMAEYQGEGLACLNTPEKTKIPVVWMGAMPKVKQAVHVDGTMAKTSHGYTFTAAKVGP